MSRFSQWFENKVEKWRNPPSVRVAGFVCCLNGLVFISAMPKATSNGLVCIFCCAENRCFDAVQPASNDSPPDCRIEMFKSLCFFSAKKEKTHHSVCLYYLAGAERYLSYPQLSPNPHKQWVLYVLNFVIFWCILYKKWKSTTFICRNYRSDKSCVNTWKT